MLFNSIEFLFAFLPVVMLVFWWLSGRSQRLAIGWLTLASLVFYGWQTPRFLVLLSASMIVNFAISSWIGRFPVGTWKRKGLLVAGVMLNLSFIGYFKYSCFLIENLNALVETGMTARQLVLPIGISFYTFQQIAYLVDRYQDQIQHYGFVDYCLFVTFFPQLIAGPIVHPKEMLPQFSQAGGVKLRPENLAVGFTIFFIGLFKKTVIADGLIGFSSPVFADVEKGFDTNFVVAWCAAVAYTLQLYFDFSGYSDMAIGLGRLFGIRLPLNFNSPYKSVNIIDFWRCWHMTLSRFLRDYIYIPLGGGRVGTVRRYLNLMATMLLGGLWHGAGWTFVLWGALHGVYLVINHLWHVVKKQLGLEQSTNSKWVIAVYRGITFVAVVFGWVLFRSTSLHAATSMFQSMLGLNGVILPDKWLTSPENFFGLMTLLQSMGVRFESMKHFDAWDEVLPLAGLLCIVWFTPNTQTIMGNWKPAYEEIPVADLQQRPRWATWNPDSRWAVISSLVTVVAILQISRASEFLYFQF